MGRLHKDSSQAAIKPFQHDREKSIVKGTVIRTFRVSKLRTYMVDEKWQISSKYLSDHINSATQTVSKTLADYMPQFLI